MENNSDSAKSYVKKINCAGLLIMLRILQRENSVDDVKNQFPTEKLLKNILIIIHTPVAF